MAFDTLNVDLSKHVGFDFDNYDPAKLEPLSPELESKWFSKYYYMGRKEVPDEVAAQIKPMDPEFAIFPGKADALMNPETDPRELGYCILPNGCGYGATNTLLPDVSFEQFRWYRKLRTFDELAYMVWYPGSHLSDHEGVCIEDLGWGAAHCEVMHPVKLTDFGFSVSPAEGDPDFIGLVGGGGWCYNKQFPELKPFYIAMHHYIRRCGENGMEFRSRFYIGMHPENGEPCVFQDNIEPEVLKEICRRLCGHAMYERETLGQFLPEVYEKMKDIDMSKASTKGEAWSMETK